MRQPDSDFMLGNWIHYRWVLSSDVGSHDGWRFLWRLADRKLWLLKCLYETLDSLAVKSRLNRTSCTLWQHIMSCFMTVKFHQNRCKR